MNKETKEEKALRDFIFEVTKSIGILWLVDKIPFLQYKEWVKKRLTNN